MTGSKAYKKIRIFVAAPPDVASERKCLETMVDQLNGTGRIADQPGLKFELIDWDTYLSPSPDAGPARFPVEKWDVFIGILWLGFGTAPEDGGREEAFKRAYEEWKRHGCPHVLFFRCYRPYPPAEIDADQLKKVKLFFEQFERDGQHPGIYRIFRKIPEFEHLVRESLLAHLEQFKSKNLLPGRKLTVDKEPPAAAPTPFAPGETIINELKAGDVYDLALLSIDIVDHSKLFYAYKSEDINRLLDKFYDFVFDTVKSFKGDQIAWAGDGGLFAFWGEDACNNSVLAGIKLMLGLIVFNLGSQLDLQIEPLKLRIAAHYGTVEFQIPTDKIHSSHINFVAHLEKNGTSPETVSVTKALFDKLSDPLKNVLAFEKKYQNTYIYTYKLPSERDYLSKSDLENILVRIRKQTASLTESIRLLAVSKNDNSDYEATRRNIDIIYNNIESFARAFSNIDVNWSREYFETLSEYVTAILEEEENLNQKVDNLYYKSDENIIRDSAFLDIIKFIGVRKTNVIPNMRLLLKQFQFHADDEKDTLTITKKELLAKIDNFIAVDEFNEEMAFFELFLDDKEELIEYILHEPRGERYTKLLARLWKLADFVLIEDVTLRKSRMAKESKLIFPVLCQDVEMGKYFRVVLQLFQRDLGDDLNAFVLEEFKKLGIEPGERDVITTLKCLLVGSMRPEVRKNIVHFIDFRRLWGVIAYSETPLEVIQVIAEYLNEIKDEDRMKVFFDLILNKLVNVIEIAKRETVFHQVRLIIIMFYSFDFFAETGYYERLEELRLKFTSRSRDYPNVKLKLLDTYFKKLKIRRDQSPNLSSSIPKGLSDIPLPIQRRLANGGRYIMYFINSPNNMIALDTIRFINVNNIETILHSPRINDVLMGWLLKNKELFRSMNAIFLALSHPRCNMAFASRYMSRLTDNQRMKIANNNFANTDVRNFAKNMLKKT